MEGVWRFAASEIPGIQDNPDRTAAIFRKMSLHLAEVRRGIEAGEFQSFNDASRALVRRMTNRE